MSTINNKLSRKEESKSSENFPWFSTLIKDFKRLSLVFKTDNNLVEFLNYFKNQFGVNHNKELILVDGLKLSLREIKNGFGIDNEYKDLKIILDCHAPNLDLGFPIEIQCHLEDLISWKAADHILYNLFREEEDIKTISLKDLNYEYQEGY